MSDYKVLYPFKNSDYQFFMQDLADELIGFGVPKVNPLGIPYKIRLLVAKIGLSRNIPLFSNNNQLFVLCAGYPDYAVFPFGYTNNIVPILWDTWPKYWGNIIASFKRHNVKRAFFTQRQVAEYVQKKLPQVQCFYIPEALNPKGYKKGEKLDTRRIDVLELGRLYVPIHQEVLKLSNTTKLTHLYADEVTKKLLFESFEELTRGLADSKIVINYPRCITHPQMAGNVETLTQRYWECMYSRCVMVGHAPQELIDFIGYNPVIEATQDTIQNVIKEILANPEQFQGLVDSNYDVAVNCGSWKSRIPLILHPNK